MSPEVDNAWRAKVYIILHTMYVSDRPHWEEEAAKHGVSLEQLVTQALAGMTDEHFADN